jgi:hypothetical protein
MDAVRVLTKQLPTADILEITDPNDGGIWIIVDPRVTQEQLLNYFDFRERAAALLKQHAQQADRDPGSGSCLRLRPNLFVLATAAAAVIAAFAGIGGSGFAGIDAVLAAASAALAGSPA